MPGRPAHLPGYHGAAVIRVYADLEALSQAAAALVVKQAELAVVDSLFQ